jgi:hypothetical protein
MKKLLFSAAMLLAGVSANAQLAPGSVAPNFTVSAYQSWLSTAGSSSNGSYSLYSYLDQGYTVFLDVSATWCGPCWNYHLTDLSKISMQTTAQLEHQVLLPLLQTTLW